jgi:hypothetical protein
MDSARTRTVPVYSRGCSRYERLQTKVIQRKELRRGEDVREESTRGWRGRDREEWSGSPMRRRRTGQGWRPGRTRECGEARRQAESEVVAPGRGRNLDRDRAKGPVAESAHRMVERAVPGKVARDGDSRHRMREPSAQNRPGPQPGSARSFDTAGRERLISPRGSSRSYSCDRVMNYGMEH